MRGKKWFLVVAVVISAAKSWGQAAPSPFTTYGLGEFYGNGLIQNQGTGTGVAQPQYWYINNMNPALLVFNNMTSFQVGVIGESRQVHGDTTNEKNSGGNLNYIAMAFPVKVLKWSTTIGLMPYTNVDFKFQYRDYAYDPLGAVVDTLVTRESGSGGLTQVYWSNGVRLTKDLSVGLRSAYMFGPISNVYTNVLTTTPNQGDPYLVNIENKKNVHGFNFALGVSYILDSLGRKKDRRVSFGAVYSIASNYKAKVLNRISRTSLAGDTIEKYTIDSEAGKVHLPESYTFGVAYGRGNRWNVSTEFFYQDWGKFKSVNSEDEGLTGAWRTALGGEFTADPYALENYLKRITFRAGVSYQEYPYYANNARVTDYGINLGLSLPAGRSSVDLAAQFGKRGDKTVNVLEETYFRIFFGITFNDQWFIKRKFD
jgi:long-subunit fatty acid transport protein